MVSSAYLRAPSAITWDIRRGRQREMWHTQRRWCKDGPKVQRRWLDWGDAATSQRLPADTRSWRCKDMDSPAELPAGRRPWWHPDLAPDFMLISDLWPLELWQNKRLLKKKKYVDHFKSFYCSYFMLWFFGLESYGILVPQSGFKPTPPASEGKVLTTGPPRKSQCLLFKITKFVATC